MIKEITKDTVFNSEQEVFNHVVAFLAKQGKKSANFTTGTCFYRHEDLKCAAGCLIPDELYHPKMEYTGWNTLCNRLNLFPDFETYLNSSNLYKYQGVIHTLQACFHDDCDFASKASFINSLKNLLEDCYYTPRSPWYNPDIKLPNFEEMEFAANLA